MTVRTFTSGLSVKAEDGGEAKLRVAKNRVQFDLPPRSMERLNVLKAKTEAASYAEVLKNALRLYEALIEETERGNEFMVRNADGVVTPYRMFLS
jgi:hypothetical protein